MSCLSKELDQPCSTIDVNRLTGDSLVPVVETVGMWESRRDSQRAWEGWEAGIMASMLSILCHFHGLFFVRQCWVNGCATPPRNTYRDQLSVSALTIWHSSRRIPAEKCVRVACQESWAHSFGRLAAIARAQYQPWREAAHPASGQRAPGLAPWQRVCE